MPFDIRKQYISDPKLWDLKNSILVKRKMKGKRKGKRLWHYVRIYNVKNDVLKAKSEIQQGSGVYPKAVMKPVRPEHEPGDKNEMAEVAKYDYAIRKLYQRLTPAEEFAERAKSQYEHVVKEGGIHMPLKASKAIKPLKKSIKPYILGPPGRRIAQM